MEENLEGGQERNEKRGAVLACQTAQSLNGVGVKGPVVRLAVVRLHRGARAVAGQLQDRQFAGQLLLPVFPGLVAARAVNIGELPADKVGKLRLQSRQFRPLTRALGLVDVLQLVHQDVHRPQVRHDVMEHQEQNVLPLAAIQMDAQDRAAFQVEGLISQVAHVGNQLILAPGLSGCDGHFQLEPRQDALNRFAFFQAKGAAQRGMALHQGLAGAGQCGFVQLRGDACGIEEVVGRALRGQLINHPQRLLAEG